MVQREKKTRGAEEEEEEGREDTDEGEGEEGREGGECRSSSKTLYSSMTPCLLESCVSANGNLAKKTSLFSIAAIRRERWREGEVKSTGTTLVPNVRGMAVVREGGREG